MPSGFPSGLTLARVERPLDSEEGPGNETRFVPGGFLLGAPAVIFPYRDMAPDRYYGAQHSTGNPVTDAPLQDPCGGTVYFETSNEDRLSALLLTMGVTPDRKDYMAFGFSTSDPVEDRYLDQMRIFTHAAMTVVYKLDEKELPDRRSRHRICPRTGG